MSQSATESYQQVGRRLSNYQQDLDARGTSLADEIERRYLHKWRSEALCHVLRVRTALVSGMQEWLRSWDNRVCLQYIPITTTTIHLPTACFPKNPCLNWT